MTPQLVIQDFGGAHNKNLHDTRARLIRGGSWKRQRIVVILPAADMIPAKVALAHWNLSFRPTTGYAASWHRGLRLGTPTPLLLSRF